MYMKAPSEGFNNKCVTLDRSCNNTIFYCFEDVHLKKCVAENHLLLVKIYMENALSDTS